MNPDPSQTVVYGPRTKDEMCQGGMWITAPGAEWETPMIVSKGRWMSGGGIMALGKEEIEALDALSEEDREALNSLSQKEIEALKALSPEEIEVLKALSKAKNSAPKTDD